MSRIKYQDRPIGFLVVIRQEEVPKQSESGIQLFALEEDWEIQQHLHGIGTVEAIGSTAFHHPKYGFNPADPDSFEPPVKVGDLVRYKAEAAYAYREERSANWDHEGGFMVYVNDAHILGHCDRVEIDEQPKAKEPEFQESESGLIIPVGGEHAH